MRASATTHFAPVALFASFAAFAPFSRATRFLTLSLALLLPLSCPAASALPPRTIGDIVALLHAAPAQSEELAAAKAALAETIPAGLSGRELANAYVRQARAAERLGLTDRYVAAYRAAWEASGRSMAPADTQLRVEYTAAEVHAGNMLAALAVQEESARSGALGGARLAAHSFLAENLARHGDQEGAERHLRQAEVEFASLQNSRVYHLWRHAWEANIERARGGAALGLGKFAEAEIHFRKAAEFRERDLEQNRFRLDKGLDTPTMKIALGFALISWRGVADVLLQQGRLVEAEMVYRDIITRGSAEFGTASPLMQLYLEGLARVLLEQGRAGDARELAATTVEILERQGTAPESRMLTSTRLRLAAAHVAMRQWQAALAQYEAVGKALELDAGLRQRLGRGDKAWALTLLRTGKPDEALHMMEQVLADDSRRFADDDVRLAEAKGFHAMMLAGTGQLQRALAEFRQAVPILLSSQRDAADEGLTGASRRLVVVLEAYLQLLERLHRERQAPADFDVVAESFRVADVARGSSVQRALIASSARAAIRDPQLAQLARDEQDLSNRIGTLTDTLSRLASAPPEQRLEKIIADMRRDIPRLKAERRQLRERIAREFPAYENLVNPKPLQPADVQRLLADDEAMLATYGDELRTYVWAIPKNGAAQLSTAELPAGMLRQRVGRIRQALTPDSASAADLGFDLDAAHEIYARVVAPAAPTLAAAKHLLVVPHGALGQLPFALLPTQPARLAKSTVPLDAYARLPWLIRDYAITQLPSAGTLAALRQQERAGLPGQSPFIGFGDPLFGNPPPVASSTASSTTPAAASVLRSARPLALRAGVRTRSSSSAGLDRLAPLPDTAIEIREMAAALGADADAALRLGKAATESAAKSGDLSRYRVVAFATHGLTPGDLDGLAQPALALANPLLTGEQDADGLLTMEEILGLKMNADWVVLSACNTASADGNSGEALSGLGRAFFYAGTRAVLATNWPVETVSAQLLTTELFRRQAAQPGLSRAQALRAAMLAVMERHAVDERTGKPVFSYAHPLFWAPFSLVGDGGAR